MTPELWWTAWTSLLTASLWIPFIVGVNTAPAGSLPFDPADMARPSDPMAHRDWVARAYRAHQNLVEAFAPMAALVVIAHVAGISSAVTVWATALFFAIRLAHAAGMITGLVRFPVRPILFTASWACTLAVAAELVRLA